MSPLLPGNWYVSSWEYVATTAGFTNDLNVSVSVCLLSWTPGAVCGVLTLVKFISPLNELYLTAGHELQNQQINSHLMKHTCSLLFFDLILKCPKK